jgi:hypothetical protein
MGTPGEAHKVKLVTGLLFKDVEVMEKAAAKLAGIFGAIDLESDTLDFTHSGYYAGEMGDDLKRKFLSFKKLIDLKDIYKVKIKTNLLEKEFLVSGKRKVNIDPGYMDLAKFVLFSTKDYTHRIYLNKGIFAEVTLFYKDKTFNAWPWTYPDYKSGAYIDILNSIRGVYCGSQ